MRIGIDIDDTITNTWNDIIPSFSNMFNIPIEKLKKSNPYYESVKDRYTIEEYYNKVMTIYDNIVPMVSLRNNVVNVLNDLHNMGHKIIFISSRGKGFSDAYTLTKNYLDSYNIKYDKLIVNANNKGDIAFSQQIDLFIDDNINHCFNVLKKGIKVLLMETEYNKECIELKHLKKWDDIYKYLEDR